MKPSARATKKKDGDAPTYTTGEMARLSKSTLRTVRFYEEAGILEPLRRTDGGHRVFDQAQLDRLLFVSDMREAGMSLDEIRGLLEVKRKSGSGGLAARAVRTALAVHVQQLKHRIEVLTRLSADLTDTSLSTLACLECDNERLFPHQCGECTRLDGSGPLPRGMRVLWGVPSRSDVVPATEPE